MFILIIREGETQFSWYSEEVFPALCPRTGISNLEQFGAAACSSLKGKGLGASLVAQTVRNLPAMWETWVRSLGWEDPL